MTHITRTTEISTPMPQAAGRRFAGAAGLAALSAMVMMSLGTAPASAQGMGGPGMEGGPRGHSMGRHHGPAEPEKMAEFMALRMAQSADATPEQKAKLMAIAKAAATDMKPLREQQMQARQKGMELLAAPTIDRAALEQLRVTQMQAADTMSKRRLQAMTDAAEVLTPAQRAKIAEQMKKRMEPRK